MRKTLDLIMLLAICLAIMGFDGSSQLRDAKIIFFYQIGDDASRELHWFDVKIPQHENHVELTDNLRNFEFSENYLVAITNENPPQLYIENLSNLVESSNINFTDWQHVPHDFLDHYVDFETVLWSPDGKQVAFVDVNRDIVLYDVETGEVINLGEIVSPPRNEYYMMPSAWSPDSQYLLIRAVTHFDDDNYPVWESVLFNREGNLELELGESLCTPVWSPDSVYIASSDWCNGGFDLRIRYVFPLAETNGFIVPSSIILDYVSSLTWYYEYRTPIWLDNDTLAAPRIVAPMTFGLVELDETSSLGSTGIINYDLQTHSETLAVEGDMPNASGEWFIASDARDNIFSVSSPQVIAYNPITNQKIMMPESVQHPCPTIYFHVETEGHYFSILDNCVKPSADRDDGLRIFSSSGQQIHFIEGDANSTIFPLGFFSVQE